MLSRLIEAKDNKALDVLQASPSTLFGSNNPYYGKTLPT